MKLAEQLEIILENRIAQDNLTLPLLPAIVAKANDVVRRTDATVKDLGGHHRAESYSRRRGLAPGRRGRVQNPRTIRVPRWARKRCARSWPKPRPIE